MTSHVHRFIFNLYWDSFVVSENVTRDINMLTIYFWMTPAFKWCLYSCAGKNKNNKINSLSCRWYVRVNQHMLFQTERGSHVVRLLITCSGQQFQFIAVFPLVTAMPKSLPQRKKKINIRKDFKKHNVTHNHLIQHPWWLNQEGWFPPPTLWYSHG